MIIFVFGEDAQRVLAKKNELITSFKEKFNGAQNNIDIIVGSDDGFEGALVQSAKSPPFLCEKRMVIAENICSNLNKPPAEALLKGLADLPESTLLLFVDNTTQKNMIRRHLYKSLKDQDQVHEYICDPLQGKALQDWVVARAKELGADMNAAIAGKLIEKAGTDASALENELKKLAGFAAGRPVSESDIETLVSATGSDVIFELMDAVSTGNRRSVIALIKKQRDAGSDDFYLLAMLLRQMRILVSFLDAKKRHGHDQRSIKEDTGLHPYVLQKMEPLTHRMDLQDLKNQHKKCFEIDKKVKTGKMTATEAVDLIVAGMLD